MRKCLFIFMCMLVTACGYSRHIGNQNLTAGKVASIQKGATTKADVLATLGPPQTTMRQTIAVPGAPETDESWSYWSNNVTGSAVVMPFYAQTTTSGSNYIVTIFFDKAGIVQNVQETTVNH